MTIKGNQGKNGKAAPLAKRRAHAAAIVTRSEHGTQGRPKKEATQKRGNVAPLSPARKVAEMAKEATTLADQERRGINASSGLFNATGVMQPFQKNLTGEATSADSILTALESKLQRVQAGDLTSVESMLFSQATALQTIFASLARKAAAQEYLKQYQAFLMLALKAQAQSRATLEALIELKHPRSPPTFVKQANISHGPQQVNNGAASLTSTPTGAHAEKSEFEQTKLLEDGRDGCTYLDSGATPAAARSDSTLAAMEAVNRSEER